MGNPFAKLRKSWGPETGVSDRSEPKRMNLQVKQTGFGRFKDQVASYLTPDDVQRLATIFEFPRADVVRLRNSCNPGLDMLGELESRGEISTTTIMRLIYGLNRCNLGGIAKMARQSFRTNMTAHAGCTSLAVEEKKELFNQQLKRRYKRFYDAVQPIPYVKDKMCCVDKVFVEGSIERRITQQGGEAKWQPINSYRDILSDLAIVSKRRIILGEAGYGKSTLVLQFLYEWCNEVSESPINNVKTVIFLRMRFLSGISSLYEAIKTLLLPRDSILSVDDIKEILQNDKSTLIIFDSFDEYTNKGNMSTDFSDIINMKLFDDTNFVVTCRSSDLRHLPVEFTTQSAQYRLTGFDEKDQNGYIMKAVVGNDTVAAKSIQTQLREIPVLNDMSQTPLFFTIVAHTVRHEKEVPSSRSVTWYFRFMLECFFKHAENKYDQHNGETVHKFDEERLGKIAFEGLCKGGQQTLWKRQFLLEKLGKEFYDNCLRTGILIEEEIVCVAEIAYASDFFQQKIITTFYHNLLCEWYAACYFVKCLLQRMSSVCNTIETAYSATNSTHGIMAKIDPVDFQYVFRFASGLNTEVGCTIIKYLTNQSSDYKKLAILCIMEYSGADEDIRDEIRRICLESVSIRKYDSKLVQRATSCLLQRASNIGVPITKLSLVWCFKGFESTDIKLDSGLCVPCLATLQRLVINGNDRVLTEEHVTGLIMFGMASQHFTELRLNSCKLPSLINPDIIPDAAKRSNVKVISSTNMLYLGMNSGHWKRPDNNTTIADICEGGVVIDNKTKTSVQNLAIYYLQEASVRNIPIVSVALIHSFCKVSPNKEIILRSGLILPVLTSLKCLGIQTEAGREMDQQEVNAILSYAQSSAELKTLRFDGCLLPPRVIVCLSVLGSRCVKVFWTPFDDNDKYLLNLASGYWFNTEKDEQLNDTAYEDQAKRFRDLWRNSKFQLERIAS